MSAKLDALARNLVTWAAAKRKKFSFAESCTGGLVGASVASVSGASAVFCGSAVTYSNAAKADILGVSRSTLGEYGAVSSECAAEMALGSLRIYEADVAVSITGVAGPSGGSKAKPVGTVWFGLATAVGVRTAFKVFTGDRREVREQAAAFAIFLMEGELKKWLD